MNYNVQSLREEDTSAEMTRLFSTIELLFDYMMNDSRRL